MILADCGKNIKLYVSFCQSTKKHNSKQTHSPRRHALVNPDGGSLARFAILPPATPAPQALKPTGLSAQSIFLLFKCCGLRATTFVIRTTTAVKNRAILHIASLSLGWKANRRGGGTADPVRNGIRLSFSLLEVKPVTLGTPIHCQSGLSIAPSQCASPRNAVDGCSQTRTITSIRYVSPATGIACNLSARFAKWSATQNLVYPDYLTAPNTDEATSLSACLAS